MKKNYEPQEFYISWLKKLWLMLRLSVLLILFASISVTASVYSQSAKLSLRMKNSKIADVFNSIEEKTGYYFFYNRDLFDDSQIVTVDFENESVTNVLDEILKERGATYRIVDRNILIEVDPSKIKNQSNQQKGDIKGKVTDTSGEPLPGVTVIVKGTTQGIITDTNGDYTLTDVPGSATLMFSFVGMRLLEISIEGRTLINVTMEEESIGLEEVVAVGYGVQKKATLTGSVINVDGEDLKNVPATNVSQTISGRLPGVVAISNGGEPGYDGVSILIRGVNTFGNSAPLIVVDGVPGRSLERIDPSTIETMSVLKDASAAIYGAQAANGVILITTKRGKVGKPTVDFTYNYGITRPTKMPEMTDAAEYATLLNEIDLYAGSDPRYTPEEIQKYRDGSDPWKYPNSDYIKETLKPWSEQTYGNVSIKGGTENVNYFVSLSGKSQDAFYRNSATS